MRLLGGQEHVTTYELMQTSRRLAAVVDTMAEASTDAYRRTRAEMASHLDHVETDLVSRLAAGEPLDPQEVEQRAQLIGVDTQLPHRALAVGLVGDSDPVVLGRAYRQLCDHVQPHLPGRIVSGSYHGALLALFPDEAEVDKRLERAVNRPELPTGWWSVSVTPAPGWARRPHRVGRHSPPWTSGCGCATHALLSPIGR